MAKTVALETGLKDPILKWSGKGFLSMAQNAAQFSQQLLNKYGVGYLTAEESRRIRDDLGFRFARREITDTQAELLYREKQYEAEAQRSAGAEFLPQTDKSPLAMTVQGITTALKTASHDKPLTDKEKEAIEVVMEEVQEFQKKRRTSENDAVFQVGMKYVGKRKVERFDAMVKEIVDVLGRDELDLTELEPSVRLMLVEAGEAVPLDAEDERRTVAVAFAQRIIEDENQQAR